MGYGWLFAATVWAPFVVFALWGFPFYACGTAGDLEHFMGACIVVPCYCCLLCSCSGGCGGLLLNCVIRGAALIRQILVGVGPLLENPSGHLLAFPNCSIYEITMVHSHLLGDIPRVVLNV